MFATISSAPTPHSNKTEMIYAELELRFRLYTLFGAVVCLTTTLEIVVFCSSKEFREKFVVFNAIAVSSLINGLSFVAAGTYRNRFLWNGTYFRETTSLECLFETPWAILMLLAGQLPALLNLFLSLERVVALECASWYRRVWRAKHKNYLVLTAFLITANISLEEGRRRMLLQSLTGVSVVLVSIPNLILILNEWELPKINDLVVGICYCLYATHSSLSLPIYIYFRSDFKKRFFWIFFRRNLDNGASTNVVRVMAKSDRENPRLGLTRSDLRTQIT